MALGDGIRRNVAHVSEEERTRFRDAILKLDRERFFPDGVSYFDKQEDIHKNAHAGGANVHGGPAFIPWHRELCNRFEALLREVDPDLSLHYWDWTTDPRSSPDGSGGTVNLLTPDFMGGDGDPVGPPFEDFESTEPGHSLIWRDVDGTPPIASDGDVKNASDFAVLDANISGPHASAHGYIGGTLTNAHFSFHDPFVFLLHSNLDRLWAEWQTEPGHPARLDGATAYGSYSAAPAINEDIQPWAGDVGTGATPLRPWAPPDNMQEVKTYKDVSVVTPPCYDTLPTAVRVVTAENPSMVVGFHQVPEGETAIRAAVFETRACGELTLRVTAGPNAPFQLHLPADGVLHVPQKPQIRQLGRIWFRFTAGTAGVPVPSSDVTIHCDETGEDFVFHLEADVIPRPKVAVLMTLDQSGSMDELAGIDTTTKRIDILHSAATSFIQLVQDLNGVGIVSFDNVAHPRFAVTQFTGGVFDPARGAATAAVQAIQPGGSTSIGAGLQLARDTLAPATGYDHKAILVLTDGLENTEPWISDVTIDDRTFAIGLGTAQEVSVGALTALANHTQGYLLLSGALSPSIDDYFRLTKYFLQVLAGMTNNDIVTDPEGFISPGAVLRIPFQLSEADIDATVVLLGDTAGLEFAVETPDGEIMGPPDAAAAGAVFRATSRMDYYRFNLPLTLGGDPAQPGTWHALLAVGGKRRKAASGSQGAPLRYSVSVHAFSNLRMRARVSQSSMEPGAQLTLRAVLTEYGVPVDHRATIDVDINRPDGTVGTIGLTEIEPGIFEGELVAALEGVYRFCVRAAGGTMRGEPFTREQLLSAAVVRGGDRPPPKSDPRGDEEARALCELLTCLLAPDRLGHLLEQRDVDVAGVRRCLKTWCRRRLGPPAEKELRAQEGSRALWPEVPREPVELTERMIATVAEILHHAERERGGGPLPWTD